MKPQTELEQNAENKSVANWLDDTDIKFSITYLDGDGKNEHVVNWQCKILQTSEEKELRQKHFALPDAEQELSRHAYNVEMLSRIATAPPIGIPGFDDILKSCDGNLKEAIMLALSSPTPRRVKLADDSLNYYTTINQPAEFFR